MQEGVAKPQRSDLIVPEVFWSSKHRIVVQGCVCEEGGGDISARVIPDCMDQPLCETRAACQVREY